MDIQARIDELKEKRDKFVKMANTELRNLSEEIAGLQQRHSQISMEALQEAARMSGAIEELERMVESSE